MTKAISRARTSYRVRVAVIAMMTAIVPVIGPLAPARAVGENVFISEIHYDNTGTDTDEFIEVTGDAGSDLTGWSLSLYNGNGGAVYDTVSLSGVLADQGGGLGTASVDTAGLQNGSPDGVALVDDGGNVVEFLSYEGSFTAVGGPADGLTSVDIGVSESSSTAVGDSLQLLGTGWSGPSPNTRDALNDGVTPPVVVFISELHYDNDGADAGEFVEVQGTAGTDLAGWSIELYNGNGGAPYDTIALSGVIDDEGGGEGALSFLQAGIQNGSPDGLALVDDAGSVVEFLSYEGSFTAVGGPADGLTSTDIGVSEESSTPAGESLQLFAGSWTGPAAESPGDLNTSTAPPPNVYISEFHYDNSGTDEGEFVEVSGDAGADLTGWSIVLYNGNGGAVYDTIALSGVIDDEGAGEGALFFLRAGIQNGSPDGMALVDGGGAVVEFLSYEGSFTAVDGAANGLTSVDVGVSETSSTPIGESLQLLDGIWTGPAAESPGDLNTAPSPPVFISEIHYDNDGTDTGEFVEVQGPAGVDLAGWTIELYNGNGGAVYATIDLTGVIDDEGAGEGALEFFEAGIQNGGPDGLALVDDTGALVQFLSYEGTFTGVGGAADGVLSTDIGVAETSSTPVGESLQLLGGVWTGPSAESPGDINGGVAPPTITPIHDVQGAGADSPLVGTTVTIEAVVVGDFQEIVTDDPTDAPLEGFFLQEEDADVDADTATSEGLFIYAPGAVDVAVGDLVRVTGPVSEFFGVTEIAFPTSISIISSGNAVPTPASPILPTTVGAPALDWESIEGMSVSFSQDLYVTGMFPLARYGEVQLSAIGPQDHPNQTNTVGSPEAADQRQLNQDARVILDDGEDENEDFSGIATWTPEPTPYLQSPEGTLRSGDTVTNLLGVVHFSFDEYEVHPINVADPTDPDGAVNIIRSNARPAVPDVGGSLRVVSFNVLNYFTTIDDGSVCGPPGFESGCRGADTVEEFETQAAKIVDALIDLDADIVGLIEIENNAGVAVADLVSRLNSDPDATRTYGYVDTGYIGTDAIAVALIFDTGTVSEAGGFAVLDDSVSPAYTSDKNRPALAQTFEDLASGETLTVAVNHLKSKGSDCLDVDNPGDAAFGVTAYAAGVDVDDPNFQGNCNLTRTAAATVLGQWLAADPTGTASPNLLILGDLNAYANEDPITALEAQGYVDVNELFSGGTSWADGAHSFVFDGELGTLDYGMANAALLSQITGAAAWHVNADEPFAIDYQNFNPPGQVSLDEFKSSDHDPIVIGITLVAPVPTCGGLEATITGSGVIFGTSGSDVIIASDGHDLIFSFGGDDIICAGDGADVVYAGWGADTVFAGDGDDLVFGSGGADVLWGEAGSDLIFGGFGSDDINGGDGDDDLFGGGGNDVLDGGDGHDFIDGGWGSLDACVNGETVVRCEL